MMEIKKNDTKELKNFSTIDLNRINLNSIGLNKINESNFYEYKSAEYQFLKYKIAPTLQFIVSSKEDLLVIKLDKVTIKELSAILKLLSININITISRIKDKYILETNISLKLVGKKGFFKNLPIPFIKNLLEKSLEKISNRLQKKIYQKISKLLNN